MIERRCRVLVVDDEAAMREVLQARLERWGYPVETAKSAGEANERIASCAPDVVITDLVLPDGTGLDLLRSHARPNRLFVVITAYGTIGTAVEAMKGGAAEYLTKPLDYGALQGLVERHEGTLSGSGARSEPVPPELELLVGDSPAMVEVRRQIATVGPSATAVMIVGESGTGKELVARAIHRLSKRAERPFVAVNAAAIPAALVEGELFGHARGAFTGADQARSGLFEQAHAGTLFLDEITEMPLGLQPKLLRVLEDGRVRRLGSGTERACDVRLITASNRDLAMALKEGLMRPDLYHRLCVFRIEIPPLRERRMDVLPLARHLLAGLAERHECSCPDLTASAAAKLGALEYPGNVRELRNLLERALLVAQGRPIDAEHIHAYAAGSRERAATDGITIPAGVTAADAERILIIETLKRTGNNKAEAARRLGLDVKTIRNKVKSFESWSGRS